MIRGSALTLFELLYSCASACLTGSGWRTADSSPNQKITSKAVMHLAGAGAGERAIGLVPIFRSPRRVPPPHRNHHVEA
jgi:hypothetical protein